MEEQTRPLTESGPQCAQEWQVILVCEESVADLRVMDATEERAIEVAYEAARAMEPGRTWGLLHTRKVS